MLWRGRKHFSNKRSYNFLWKKCNVNAIYKTNTNNNTMLFYYIMIKI